ncbi:ATP-dependent helicase HrpB [Pararhodospirillum oryzae]|uniref:ATP-dependent helicase HrpB n=1 Tax=Pararhodospirillum oryzae TaxID=478448 RepID=A0A512H570_9PROT|nr:ATP-dependent helicase HrpB [Pararhodospirillum oryzae]GEO80591.1 ATP-dependent helicase HrpB [Pararhodospirillum oryzae]
MSALVPLPIDPLLPAVHAALARTPGLVLIAPPGAGKTTRLPPALLSAPWLEGRRVLMLEPRRLAARAAATRMAAEHGEDVGATFGYRIRNEARVSAATRVEVLTEGILTRRLHDDPGLEGVGAVVLDEFHERGLTGDLAFALLRDIQGVLRPDLRLIVMSATLDGAAVAALMDNAPVLESQGRAFPVAVRHQERPLPRALPAAVAATTAEALERESGSILVFLPGEREIRATAGALRAQGLPDTVDVHALFGALAPAAQDLALRPAPAGRRKVVLATDIAETSLTIEGVRVVIDSGLRRVPRFDPRRGLGRLETVRISQAGAEQRRGRAGRLEPGLCVRLWPEAEHRALPAQETPEILAADLAGLALDLALWGAPDPAGLAFPTQPPAGALAQARDILRALEALDASGRITPHGRALAALPLPPRLAHMVVRASARGPDQGALACLLAAMLEERDLLAGNGQARDADVASRLALLAAPRSPRAGKGPLDERLARVRAEARRLGRLAGCGSALGSPTGAGAVLALAYPDRVALARPGAPGRFLLASGRGACLATDDPLAGAPALVVADLDGAGVEARVYLAARLDPAELETVLADRIETIESVTWDPRTEAVVARRERRLGALVLAARDLPGGGGERAQDAVIEGIRRLGLGCLPWTPEATRLVERVRFLARACPDQDWPDFSEAALLDTLEDWLGPFLAGVTRRAHFARVALGEALRAALGPGHGPRLDRWAPTHVTVPSGASIPLEYGPEDGPVLAARVQQLFGLTDTPRVADGRRPVVVHLLSPAGRPLQVTRDLAGFWRTSYADVRKDMRGRYPKHPWPEDPTLADATNRAKPRGKR